MFWGVVPRCGSWGGAFSAVRSRHRRGAERETCESENQKFFDCLVHGVPSLSFLLFRGLHRRLHIARKVPLNFLTNFFALFLRVWAREEANHMVSHKMDNELRGKRHKAVEFAVSGGKWYNVRVFLKTKESDLK